MLKRILNSGLVWLWLTVLVLLLDRISKTWMVTHLTPYEPFPITSFLNFTLSFNKGAAFSFLNSASGWQTFALGGFALIASILIIGYLFKLPTKPSFLTLGLCLILAGALGNLWDRFLYGYVIDFINFHLGSWHYAIFNIADSAVCMGVFMIAIHWFKQKK